MIYQLIHHHFHYLHLCTPERKANPSLSLLTYALDKLATATTIAPLIWQCYSNSNPILNFKSYISTSINTLLATSPQGVKRAAPLEWQRICCCKKECSTSGLVSSQPGVVKDVNYYKNHVLTRFT